MLLRDKVAIIHGAAGQIGSTVARRFAAEGARLFLCGRTADDVLALAAELRAAGHEAEGHQVDALDGDAVEAHAAMAFDRAGRIDVGFNAVGFDFVQGVPLLDIDVADFMFPITTGPQSQFLTSRAAARHMGPGGVVLTLSASPARLAVAGTSGFAVSLAAIEALTRTLSAELGPKGIRVVCLRPHRIGETLKAAPDLPMDPDKFIGFLEDMTLLKRLPTLDDVASAAAFMASDQAAAITGAVANLTCGMAVD
ncbi:MAG TPA: SDR family oxidoreductase [Brevundimonas sp.]|nr:SDR family oxidoreductase [Brevundimonas sp.]